MADSWTPAAEYDRFADIYAVWTEAAASTRVNLAFYRDPYLVAEGLVVELGVGDGRIAVQAAAQGRDIIGVDVSLAMLRRCRRRAEEAGVLDRLALIHADFPDLQLEAPASLISLPYHSLGHLLTLGERRQALTHVHSQLRPGGIFIFDDFLMTPALVDHMRRVAGTGPAQGNGFSAWSLAGRRRRTPEARGRRRSRSLSPGPDGGGSGPRRGGR